MDSRSKVDVYLNDLFKIPNQKGIMIISEDGAIIASYGDMVNDFATGSSILSMYQTANKINIRNSTPSSMSLYFHDHVIVVTSANKRVYIVKKSLQNENSLGNEKEDLLPAKA